ncbi:MAG: hypothetical protein ACTSYX_09475 [Candidatus Thorarchaeota archaeon]
MNNWQTDNYGLEIDDPISKLTGLPPYKRSEDKRGHDTFLGGRFPKEMARRISKLKEQGPYQTTSDVVRDAIWLGTHILELRYDQDPEWRVSMQLMNMANESAWEANIYEEEDQFARSIDKLCANGDEQRAIELVEERISLISSLPNPVRRRDMLIKSLRGYRLGSLLDKVGVS